MTRIHHSVLVVMRLSSEPGSMNHLMYDILLALHLLLSGLTAEVGVKAKLTELSALCLMVFDYSNK